MQTSRTVDVDNYCERTAPGLWGEPANALSNLAFLVAAGLLLWLLAREPRRAPVSVWLLPILLGVVGLCSLAFHTFATGLTGALDSLSILLFILVAVVVIVHWVWGVSWKWAWLAAPAYVALAVALSAAVRAIGGDRALLGGYLPALAGLVGFALAIRYTTRNPVRGLARWLFAAAATFAVSLTFRTLDEPWCQSFPLGTHFAWHCLNAIVLFLVGHFVICTWQLVSGEDALGAPGDSTSVTRP